MDSCDYLLMTGHRRGCSIEACDKYVKGKHSRKRANIDISSAESENWNDIPITEVREK